MQLAFHILRIKCETRAQSDFFADDEEPANIIMKAFQHKPSAQIGGGAAWRIGNVEDVFGTGISFALGRVSKVTVPSFDEDTRDFSEFVTDRAPFTIGTFDPEYQVCTVVKRSGILSNAREMANKLQKLLNQTEIAQEYNRDIIVDPIWDPIEFFESIEAAHSITRFRFVVSNPNPHDVERLIQRPAEEFNKIVGGSQTVITSEGDSLDRDVIQETAAAIAAVGHDASATIRPYESKKRKVIHLKGNPLEDSVEVDDGDSIFKLIYVAARRAYDRVRYPVSQN